jgi:uncharacterized repeat protein (TIGR01451 family)
MHRFLNIFIVGILASFIGYTVYSYPVTRAVSSHPVLVTSQEITDLANNTAEWTKVKQFADANLDRVISPSYEGLDWRGAIEEYASAYQVTKRTDAALATLYGKKALAIMKVLARDHQSVLPNTPATLLGQGTGSKTIYALPFSPKNPSQVKMLRVPTRTIQLTYTGTNVPLGVFAPIVKISNTVNGNADYSPSDYHLDYRSRTDTQQTFLIRWGANHPATGATFYVTVADGAETVVPATSYTISGLNLTLNTAPSTTESIFASYMGADYTQTGNGMGGVDSVMPNGPGFAMRAFNIGLAHGYDLMYDFPDFTTALKQEFYTVLNSQIDWYKSGGYHKDEPLGNYYTRGYLAGTLLTTFATQNENPRFDELKTLTSQLIHATATDIAKDVPGGYGPEGSYTNGSYEDIFKTFTLWKRITGEDLFAPLQQWVKNVAYATIHGTKPDRKTFYDGGDWSTLPAETLTYLSAAFIKYLPTHEFTPYMRQHLKDAGIALTYPGTVTDYKTIFPLAYRAEKSGPLYTRSGWDSNAVWLSLAAGQFVVDHQHRDQGHLTVQRGTDYLIPDTGDYGESTTFPYHNTLGFDDRGAGDISNYPPGQGYWGFDDVAIQKFTDTAGYTYAQADFTRSYAQAHEGTKNSVKLAVRSLLYIRPDIIIIHDRAQTFNSAVKKIFNMNFAGELVRNGAIFEFTQGGSKIFMKPLFTPATPPVITQGTFYAGKVHNYQQTITGSTDSTFLHIVQATSNTQTAMTPSLTINSTNGTYEGVNFALGTKQYVSLFSKSGYKTASSFTYNVSATGNHEHILADIPPQVTYKVVVTSGGTSLVDKLIKATPEGLITFTYTAPSASIVTVTPLDQASIESTLSTNKTAASPGDVVTYTLTYSNIGTKNASMVKLLSPIPPGTTYVAGSASTGGALEQNSVAWTIPSVAVGGTGTVTYQAKIN